MSEPNLVLLINETSRIRKGLVIEYELIYKSIKMTNLDLNKFGVQELNTNEMVELEGGQRTPAGRVVKAIGDFVSWVAETFM